jgi:anti-sigma regulatory factor (Ser/Thr protein kinase)
MGGLIAIKAFPAEADAVRHVRRFVTEHLPALGLEARTDDVLFVVTELAANAILHARTPFEVGLFCLGDGGRIEVRDGSATLPPVAIPPPGRSRDPQHGRTGSRCGRGLTVVDALSAEWGTHRSRGGKVVWCELTSRFELQAWPDLDVDALLDLWDRHAPSG